MEGGDEIPLSGGNASAGVVRVGRTVRRPAGPWTLAVHALLTHLHSVGFAGAPRPLGIDEQGREVLSFIPGAVPWPDHFRLLDADRQLRRVARLIRDFHDAVAEFIPPPDAQWLVLIPADGAEIIAHHDLAPWNLVIGDRWAFIDWDTAAPGTRLWDLAYALHGFVPLSADPQWQRPDAARRIRVIADAYGLDQTQRHDLLALLASRTQSMVNFLAAQAAAGTQPWTKLWQDGNGRGDGDARPAGLVLPAELEVGGELQQEVGPPRRRTGPTRSLRRCGSRVPLRCVGHRCLPSSTVVLMVKPVR